MDQLSWTLAVDLENLYSTQPCRLDALVLELRLFLRECHSVKIKSIACKTTIQNRLRKTKWSHLKWVANQVLFLKNLPKNLKKWTINSNWHCAVKCKKAARLLKLNLPKLAIWSMQNTKLPLSDCSKILRVLLPSWILKMVRKREIRKLKRNVILVSIALNNQQSKINAEN
jgi:hypothetical protein